MIGVDEARARILARFAPLEREHVPLLDADGLVAAQDVVADAAVPPFRNAAMDGYALRAADVATPPTVLRVVEQVPAGTVALRSLQPGEAARIMTGAPVPEGADCVVRFEETDEVDSPTPAGERTRVEIRATAVPGQNVREAGEDIRPGDVAVRAGTLIGPATIGVLASLNVSRVAVHRRPVVGILATGDEVSDLGAPLEHGRIRNSNSYILAALVRRYGGVPRLLGVARDSTTALREVLSDAGQVDLLVTSGGVSVGDFDVVKDVLREDGTVDIWQVRMKPGKPLAFGTLGGTPVLGLPGNPVAALVSFEQFGRPALLTMLGRRDLAMPTVRAVLTERLDNRGGRRHFVRGVLRQEDGEFHVSPIPTQGSAMLAAAASANCLIVIPETDEYAEQGSVVDVQLPDPAAALATVPERSALRR